MLFFHVLFWRGVATICDLKASIAVQLNKPRRIAATSDLPRVASLCQVASGSPYNRERVTYIRNILSFRPHWSYTRTGVISPYRMSYRYGPRPDLTHKSPYNGYSYMMRPSGPCISTHVLPSIPRETVRCSLARKGLFPIAPILPLPLLSAPLFVA